MKTLEIPLREFPSFVRADLWEQSDRSEVGPCVTIECWADTQSSVVDE